VTGFLVRALRFVEVLVDLLLVLTEDLPDPDLVVTEDLVLLDLELFE
jgi:hypothetical protein